MNRFILNSLQCRCSLLSSGFYSHNNNGKRSIFISHNTKPNWDKAVSEAEKIVGYPPSFANLRWLLSDEIANVAKHLRKLVGTNHPILHTAKHLLYNDKNNTQAWGLLILLVSKATGYTQEKIDDRIKGEILHSQRTMAEIIEMIRTGHLVHKGLINFVSKEYTSQKDNLNFGNKIALLTGDYLLVTANGMLAKLKNQHLSEIVSSALRDLAEGEFLGNSDPQNIPIPSKTENMNDPFVGISDHKIRQIIGYGRKFEPVESTNCLGNPVREWTLRNTLGGGSLLGVGCQGVLHLGGHSEEVQCSGYLLGCHAALAWQASYDYSIFASSSNSENYSLVSAPVLFALNESCELFEKISCCKDGVNNVDYGELTSAVRKSSALSKTTQLFQEHSNAALNILETFPDCKATLALRNIILALNIQ